MKPHWNIADAEVHESGLLLLVANTSLYLVDYYLSKDFKYVGWHSNEYNFGSRGVAEEVGLK